MLKVLGLRCRQGQQFYKGVAELAKLAWTRPYATPLLFLVIKHYADRFGVVDYFNRIIEWDEKQALSKFQVILQIFWACTECQVKN